MPALTTTLRTLLETADGYFWEGRLAAARKQYDSLLERSQERTDRAMEVIARSMLARYYLKRKELEAASDELALASRVLDPMHIESHSRYRAVLARLAVAESDPDVAWRELLRYLSWAEEAAAGGAIVDASLMLANQSIDPEDAMDWTRRAVESALDHKVHDPLPGAYNGLAILLDQAGDPEGALEAYEQALHWESQGDNTRKIVALQWAVGAAAGRCGEWPLARQKLEDAIATAEQQEDCSDYLSLALAELAQVMESAGDVIEARRLLIRSLQIAEDEGFRAFFPQRWRSMREYAKKLEVD